ncbi:MAG: manganese efflux pump MntP family protein [Polyangiales bacterium]|nr:manganese efflux pump [Myxococcales bacterium]
MSFTSIVLLAVGLAMDAVAVAATRGLAVPQVELRHTVRVALFFGGFQAIMPAIGSLVGAQVSDTVAAWDHWVVFALLGVLGAKMLWEARGGDEASSAELESRSDAFAYPVMFALAFATSIDALAVGITLPMLHAPLLQTFAIIGVVTAVLSAMGLHAGRRFGATLGKRVDVLGGCVLIGLGTKILIEHLHA